MQHLRQGLPAPMHLDDPGKEPQRDGRPAARGFLYRHGRLHELWTVLRVLPVRRDQDGPQLRAVELRAPSDPYLQLARLAGLKRILRQDPSRGLEQRRRGRRAQQGCQEKRSAPTKGTRGFKNRSRTRQARASARKGVRSVAQRTGSGPTVDPSVNLPETQSAKRSGARHSVNSALRASIYYGKNRGYRSLASPGGSLGVGSGRAGD